MAYYKVTEEKLDLQTLLAQIEDPSFGAQVVFSGIVRDFNHGKKVVAVSYDAFAPLAEKSFKAICEEVHAKLDLQIKAVVAHRVGRLQVGDLSLIIVVGSRHRDAAYTASRYIIEQIKVRTPIWKKEFYEDGETQWLKGHALCECETEAQHADHETEAR